VSAIDRHHVFALPLVAARAGAKIARMIWGATPMRLMLAIAVAAAVPLVAARADQNQKDADAAWKTAGQCAHAAFKKFPDYTPDSNAKREAAKVACLRDHKLPVPSAPSQTATGVPQ
jgi:hypothetical protein